MRIYLIRHGMTAGNLQKRYIGRTDQPLCAEGEAQLQSKRYPAAARVFCSPLSRCVQTARLIYPDLSPVLLPGLAEMDFGEFEGKNYAELSGDARYQRWVDGGGMGGFPGGEDRAAFCVRCRAAFAQALALPGAEPAAFVVHGGTIMAVLSGFAVPTRDYFDWHAPNGGGFSAVWQSGVLTDVFPI